MIREEARSSLHTETTNEAYIEALQTLAKEGNVHDLTLIIQYINNPNESIATMARQTASQIIRKSLLTNFNEFDEDSRKKLAHILDSLDPNIIAELAQEINGDIEKLQLNAIMILGLLKNQRVTKHLLSVLIKDKSEKVRATAVHSLGNIANRNDLTTLMKQLTDEDNRVRANTVEALEALGSPQLLLSLKRIKYDANNRVRANILKAIYNLGDHNIERDLAEMLDTRNERMVLSALWVIKEISIESMLLCKRCEALLLETTDSVSKSALKALKRMRLPRAQEIVTSYTLNHHNDEKKGI